MAAIKAYTDLEQSRKLAEILPLESADMWYQHIGFSFKDGSKKLIYLPMVVRDNESDKDVPCWSLAALLNIIPYHSSHRTYSGWRCDSYDKEGELHMFGEPSDNPVDACYETILELHERNLL